MPGLSGNGVGDPYKAEGPGRGMISGIDRNRTMLNKRGPFAAPDEDLIRDVVTKFEKKPYDRSVKVRDLTTTNDAEELPKVTDLTRRHNRIDDDYLLRMHVL
jgi:hypothetical protein